MQFVRVDFKKLNNLAKTPTRGSEWAAGYDLYAAIDQAVDIAPHSTVKVGTGLSFALPHGTFAALVARSGIATKRGLRPANCVGICDSDYRGEYMVAVHNDSDEMQSVEPGERIAQMVVLPSFQIDFIEVKDLSDTERGAGGFGDSGKF